MREEQQKALRTDGDGYHQRNHAGIGTIADPVFEQLTLINQVSPIQSYLEIGCTTGFRVDKASRAFNCKASGLEASEDAVAEGHRKYPEVELVCGLAPDGLTHWNGLQFDCIVLGHFLYLLPREQLFALASSVDSLLAENGHLIVMDFIYPKPMSAPYAHHDDLTVFKGNPSAPWLWSPTYSLVGRQIYSLAQDPALQAQPSAWQTVDVLKKLSIAQGYPVMPTAPSVHDGER